MSVEAMVRFRLPAMVWGSAESEASCWMPGQCKDKTSLLLVLSYCALGPHSARYSVQDGVMLLVLYLNVSPRERRQFLRVGQRLYA